MLNPCRQLCKYGPRLPIYKEFNKSFKLQYYIPVCSLLLYMDCGYKWIEVSRELS